MLESNLLQSKGYSQDQNMLKVYFPHKFSQISAANDNQYLPRSRSRSKWNLFKLPAHPAKDGAISSQVISFIPLLSEMVETENLERKKNAI